MAVSTMVDTAKKKKKKKESRKQTEAAIWKVVNVMEIVYFYETFICFTKKFFPLLTL